MAFGEPPDRTHHDSPAVSANTINFLERMDNWAHILVAVFLILMSASVLFYICLLLVRQFPLLAEAMHSPSGAEPAVTSEGTAPFLQSSLELLSDILFVVIILELLKTIITYLQTRDIRAIMKEFLVVGIISSIRKILLVGAQSSLAKGEDKGWEYIKEAGGTVISIIGILLLILGLVVLQRNYDRASPPEFDNRH